MFSLPSTGVKVCSRYGKKLQILISAFILMHTGSGIRPIFGNSSFPQVSAIFLFGILAVFPETEGVIFRIKAYCKVSHLRNRRFSDNDLTGKALHLC